MTRPFDLWLDKADADRSIARVTQTWMDEINRNVEMRHVLMVVEVIFGDGVRMRAATSALECSDVLGSNRWVAGVLPEETPVLNDYNIDNPTSSARSLSFRLPSRFVEPLRRLRNGYSLSGFGEVSLLVDGMSWNSRRVVLRGDMSGGVSFGPYRRGQTTNDERPNRCDSGAVSFALQDPRESADFAFPPFIVDVDRFPDAPDVAIGTPYPIVFGNAITVAPHIGNDEVLAAYGTGWDVTTVWRDGASVAFTATATLDAKGTPVTTVGGLAGGALADEETVLVELESLSSPRPSIVTLLRDAARTFAPHSSLLINGQLFSDAEAKVGGSLPARSYANTTDTFISWAEGDLLDSFPMVAMVWESGRWGPVVTDFRSPPRMQLVVGTLMLRFRLTDPVETPKVGVFNQFTLRYGYDTLLDEFTKVQVANKTTDSICEFSERTAGPRPYPAIDSIHIDTEEAADSVISWLVAHRTLPTLYLEYGGPAALFWLLRRGDTVSLTDRDFEWDGVRATVERIEYQRSFVRLGLRVWDNRLRNRLITT